MAISVSVRFHNMLRHHTGVEQETIVLPEGTLLHVALEDLARHHGPGLQRMLFAPEGVISPHLVIFRNQQLLPRDRGDVTLVDGDELLLFPAISGG
ncbi:MAG TPA: MoaD/ThiS family protein [Anaerolineae bacterium]|nr:MoaD/ThiS family protein [Anaerolineae bacterium]